MSIRVTRTPSAAKMLAYSSADHPGADHGEGPRQLAQPQDVVAGQHVVAVEGHVRIAGARGAHRDHDVVRAHAALAAPRRVLDAHRVLVLEGRVADDDLDVVAQQLGPGDVHLAAHDVIGAHQQVLHRDAVLGGVGGAVHVVQAPPRQVHGGLAQGLARDGPGVDADPAQGALALADRRPAAELGRLDRRVLARRPGADDQQVEVVLGHRAQAAAPPGASEPEISWAASESSAMRWPLSV